MENRILTEEGMEIDSDRYGSSSENTGDPEPELGTKEKLTSDETPPIWFSPTKSLDWKLGSNARSVVLLTKLNLNPAQLRNSKPNNIRHNTGTKLQNVDARRFGNRGRRNKCDVCGMNFESPSMLKGHSKIHMNERSFQCQTCPKLYKHKRALIAHNRIHSGEKPLHKCHKCRKKFFSKINLAIHMKAHYEMKSFECSKCGRKFSRKSSLTVHACEAKAKSFECQTCGKKFLSKSRFTIHSQLR